MHLASLRTNFDGTAGRKLLETYYLTLAECEGAIGYVAESQGNVLGYICGIWQPKVVQIMLIRRFGIRIFFWGLFQVLHKPSICVHSFRRLFNERRFANQNIIGYELRPIVVVPEARGSGIAAQLVKTIMSDAAQRGFPKIYLYTEDTNDPANAFYRKNGFSFVSREIHSGQVYNRYEGATEKYS